MSFRKDSDRSHAWNRWVDQHRDELTAAGVPAEIYSDKSRWQHFLQEGGLDWNTGWRVEMLSPPQAARLHAFLVREYSRPDSTCLRSLNLVMRRQ